MKDIYIKLIVNIPKTRIRVYLTSLKNYPILQLGIGAEQGAGRAGNLKRRGAQPDSGVQPNITKPSIKLREQHR